MARHREAKPKDCHWNLDHIRQQAEALKWLPPVNDEPAQVETRYPSKKHEFSSTWTESKDQE